MEGHSPTNTEQSATRKRKQTSLRLNKPRITILVVEDEPFVRSATCELLNGLGYHAVAAKDAADARRMFAALGEKIKLLLCDQVLPDENGIELAEFLRAESPRLRVVMVSGYPKARLKIDGRDYTSNFLNKPYTATLLVSKIEMALNGGVAVISGQIPVPAAKELTGAR